MRKPVIQQKPPYALGSVDKALKLIQILRDSGYLRLVDAAKELDVSPATAHRLLSMLVYRGFAIQDDSRAYMPGPSIGERAVMPSGSLKLKGAVQPYLEKLSRETGETANLMIRVGTNIRFLSTVESRNALRVGDRRGAVLPASRASGGKALLAELDLASLRKLFQVSEETTDPEFLRLTSDLDHVRRQGFATNFELTEDGVCAVGAALHVQGTSIAAVSVSLPALRLENAVKHGLIEAVLRARRDIESVLAEHPNIPVT